MLRERPVPVSKNLHVLQPNIQFFVINGAWRHFQLSNTGPGREFCEIKRYLLARLLWNPDIDAGAVMTKFLDGYCWAAGPWMGKYIAAPTTSGSTSWD